MAWRAMGQKVHEGIWGQSLKQIHYVEDLGINGKTILTNHKETGWEGVD